MRGVLGVALAGCLLGLAGEASAASILNNDIVSREFRVTMADGRSRIIRAWGGHEKQNVCPMGCEISFGDVQWTLTGNEQIVIENGKVGIRRR